MASSGGGVASGEGSSKRPNTRGGLSSKKKKSPSTSQAPPLGPLLFDSSIEWWGEDKVMHVQVYCQLTFVQVLEFLYL